MADVTAVRIPQRVLVVSGAFGPGLDAERVVGAIARGLQAGGRPEPDLCPLPPTPANAWPRRALAGEQPASPSSVDAEWEPGDVRELLDSLRFDARMRASRAVIVGTQRLHERTLAGSVTFELATRARQGGVPAYAVTGENALDAFDARMLDLQLIVQATGARALAAAGRRLASVV